MVAGTNNGDLYLWKLNFDAIKYHSATSSSGEWIEQYKPYRKSLQNVLFSASNAHLMMASSEG